MWRLNTGEEWVKWRTLGKGGPEVIFDMVEIQDG